ncbi:nickel ABC transporter permease [Phytoactinopolyspora limicola]|uniref:nickel ABC transporter permease n=1 Tax=Phytoactinopolyspora limicola TaxID=2715536 RepID=UPI001409D1B9|nr:nickel ABC transporter permease [Phytoactinopolyspora limicola]
MIRAVGFRLASVVPVLLGISVISFFLIRLVPGDVVSSILGQDYGDPELEASMREYFGLDRPVHEQFGSWFTSLIQGDLGHSMRTGRPVTEEILDRFPQTLELALAALLVSVAISIPLGVISATRRNGVLDTGSRLISLIGLSLPNFWLGILLVLVFSVHLSWLPSGGYTPFAFSWDHFKYLLLPAVTLGTSLAAVTMRMTRSALLEVLNQEYVRTARSKGLREIVVINRHALRNALIPVVTVIGIQTGALLGGTVVIEQVFSWPGLGTLVIRAISQRDYPLVQGTILFLAVFYVVVNLIVDLIYLYLDPRLRHDA